MIVSLVASHCLLISYGNVCGRSNSQVIAGINNSGLDLSDRKYLFYFQPSETGGLKICVSACPAADGTALTASGDNLCLGQDPYLEGKETEEE